MDVLERLQHFSVDSAPDLDALSTRATAVRTRRLSVRLLTVLVLLGATTLGVALSDRSGPIAPIVGSPTTDLHSEAPPPTLSVPSTSVPGEIARLTFQSVGDAIPADLPIVPDTDHRVEWLRLDPDSPALDEVGIHTLRGHRTTYGAALYHLDRVQIGDSIQIDHRTNRDTYLVTDVRVLPADAPPASAITDPEADAWLVIVAPHPRFSSDQQLAIIARRE